MGIVTYGQQDSIPKVFKKKVLERAEVDMLMSYYQQEGTHAAVTGGIGTEELSDVTPTLVIRMPLNEDDVLTADVGFSAYTSASSSNGNPFNTGASERYDDDRPQSGITSSPKNLPPTGTPWQASTGASRKDVLTTLNVSYSHASDNRNRYWGAGISGATEYDYESIGFSGNLSQLLFQKNTEIALKAQVFFDRWKPIIPTEIHEYQLFGSNFLNDRRGYFYGVDVLNQSGAVTDAYLPANFEDFPTVNRNSFTGSLFISQIFSKRLQAALFADYVFQSGWLANPLQRVYFADRPNYYIGVASSIRNYASPENTDVFHLADDIERLPDERIKIPIGSRLHFYVNENIVIRTYYRYYWDNWDITSNTFQIEMPIKIGMQWKVTPIYRYYNQTAAAYFAPYDQLLSSNAFYTSDYDLSAFSSNQYGLGVAYTDIFTRMKIAKLGMKSITFRFQNYIRSDGLNAFIVSGGVSFVMD